jgi:hypothetical protein
MTLKEIIMLYLVSNGFDGLYFPGDCGCEVADIMPCGEPSRDCQPGYKGPCDCGDHDWHIGAVKP